MTAPGEAATRDELWPLSVTRGSGARCLLTLRHSLPASGRGQRINSRNEKETEAHCDNRD